MKAGKRAAAPRLPGIESAIRDLRAGRMVVVVDDEDRENEGDFVVAAEKATPDAVNFMAREARGLICVSMTSERLEALGLSLMAPINMRDCGSAANTRLHNCSVDAVIFVPR